MYKRTILIVDDQEINREILGEFLKSDYEIMYAANGKQALEIMKKYSDILSAVLLDIIMPVMDGYEVLEEILKDTDISKIPVIVSSQMGRVEDEIKALSLGAQDYVPKPYNSEIIRHRLNNIIIFRETSAIINKAERDEITGLYNKPFFIKKVHEFLAENADKKYDIISVGIEQFKLINETYGVLVGDKVLAYIGSVIQDICKETNICGRFLPDAFFGLIPHYDEYSNEMFKNLYEIVNEYPIDMNIKLHSGVYMIDDLSVSVESMCNRAQLASDMNRGKYEELFYLYDESLREKLLEEQFITNHMKDALKKKEFVVYYQPKYDCSTGAVSGAEALVRWDNPEKGFMSPGSFIPIFEKNGLIMQLDEYVWETACRDIRLWMDKGYPIVPVSVNVSRADIYNPNFLSQIKGLVEKYKIPIKSLHLEITETAYTENPKQIIKVVRKLRKLGFAIEMDDFGSGYSSLNMLAELPVDVLKLDMGFIQSETRYASGKGILSFVISLAKWLNLAVIAEGVETIEQLNALRSMDCDYVQGYYYSKPIKEEEFVKLINESNIKSYDFYKKEPEFIEENNQVNVQNSRVMLIVDDIKINRTAIAVAFSGDFTIVECENGMQAWEYIEKNHNNIDVVISDLLMPVMDGFHLLKKIRANDNTRVIPVIVMSQGDEETEQRIFELGADDFMAKPLNPEAARHRVANVIDSCRYRQI